MLTDPNGLIWGYQDFENDGHKYRRFVWFDGKKVGKGFTAFTPAKDGTVIALKDGDAARLYRNGTYDYLPGPPKITISGQETLNAAAGAFDGGIPFGRQIRHALGLTGGVDEDATEYKNSSYISAGVVIGASMLDGGGEVKAAEVAEEAATQATPNRIYSARVLLRSAEESGPYHNFPESFNEQIFQGSRTVIRDFFKVDKQALSNDSILYRTSGSINGETGTFEIGVRPSVSGRTEVITHRFFRPGP